MKISVNDNTLFELSEVQKKVIMNDVPEEIFQEDMNRRLKYILTHKYEQCFERLKSEWEPKLSSRMDSIPTNKEAFAELVFSQSDYKSRSQRERENKTVEHLRKTGQL